MGFPVAAMLLPVCFVYASTLCDQLLAMLGLFCFILYVPRVSCRWRAFFLSTNSTLRDFYQLFTFMEEMISHLVKYLPMHSGKRVLSGKTEASWFTQLFKSSLYLTFEYKL